MDRVLLIGMMGAGKTTVGQALSQQLGWPYLDNDELVAEAAGASKSELVQTAGTAVLRAQETAALERALTRPGPLVAGVAGGVVLDQRNVALLADRQDSALVVWLRCGVATLAARIAADPQDRPWLGDDLETSLAGLLAAREPGYAAAADLAVDVDRLPLAEVVDTVVAALRRG